jgi:peptidoglycan/LPS O-acetylase OafA/YrhL
MLYYVVHMPETVVGRVLNTRILGRLGILSYSLYLLHATVLLEMNRLLHAKVLAAIVAFVVAIILSEATHILVERPSERLRKRFAHTEAPRPQHSIEPRATLTAQLESN